MPDLLQRNGNVRPKWTRECSIVAMPDNNSVLMASLLLICFINLLNCLVVRAFRDPSCSYAAPFSSLNGLTTTSLPNGHPVDLINMACLRYIYPNNVHNDPVTIRNIHTQRRKYVAKVTENVILSSFFFLVHSPRVCLSWSGPPSPIPFPVYFQVYLPFL